MNSSKKNFKWEITKYTLLIVALLLLALVSNTIGQLFVSRVSVVMNI
jgi:hypothetical protein